MSEPTPENTEIPAEIPEPVEAPAPEQPEPEPEKRGRGRPAGAKDRVKRTVKPKVRIEPIPAEPAAEPSQPSQPSQPQPAPPPPPEPPSPRTMYRQTSEQLLHLRGLMQDNRRATAAQAYTQKLSMWPVV